MSKYYPIEAFHWAGMKDEHIEELRDILNVHPEYVNSTNKYGDNCLFIASKSGDIEIVKYLVEEASANLNHVGEDGNALMVAISSRQYEIADYLIDKGINIAAKSKNGSNVFHIVANIGNADYIEKLLEIDGADVKIEELDNNNRHCLYNLISSYSFHKDYYCFELIQSSLSDEIILGEDIQGVNVIDFAFNTQNEMNPKTNKNKGFDVDSNVKDVVVLSANVARGKLLAPLINVLKSRFNSFS